MILGSLLAFGDINCLFAALHSEKVWGDLIMAFQDPKGGQERRRDHFQRSGVTGVASS